LEGSVGEKPLKNSYQKNGKIKGEKKPGCGEREKTVAVGWEKDKQMTN